MWFVGILFTAQLTIILGQFEQKLEYTIQENQPSGFQVGRISSDMIHSKKKGDPQFIDSSFTYIMRDRSEYFQLDPQTSALKTDKTIDLEMLCPKWCNDSGMGFINLVINVWKVNHLRGVIQVKVVVLDQNDNIPIFQMKVFVKKIKEVVYGIGKIIELPKAIDRDITTEFNRVTYKLNEQSKTFRLQISNDSNPQLLLVKDIDYEIEVEYSMTLIAWNAKSPIATSYLEIKIEVLDINDCEPMFPNAIVELMIDENTKTGKIITKLKAIDKDKNSKLIYGMTPATKQVNNDTFLVKENGEVILIATLDVYIQNMYDLPVFATDGEFTANAKLKIIVRDVNNHPPSYNLNPAIISIEENQPPQILIGQVTVSDVDSNEVNGQIRCSEPQGKSNLQPLLFRPDPADNPNILKYDMYSRVPLDREEQTVQFVYLICQDGGLHQRLTSTLTVSLTVVDLNDNPPEFLKQNYTVEIAENNSIGDKMFQIQAIDKDHKDNAIIRYSIVNGPHSNMFFIDESTGWINVMRELDREENDRFQLIIMASNKPRKPSFSASATLYIIVTDKNDNHPRLKPPSQFSVMENLKPGTFIGNIIAEDKDHGSNGKLAFASLTKSYDRFFDVKKNGSIFSKMSFDREVEERYCLNIRVSDLGLPQALTVTGTICIVILDANDNSPIIAVINSQSESQLVGDDPPQNTSATGMDGLIIASVYEAAGFKLASVTAKDNDKEENSQTTFMLEEIKEDVASVSTLFMIDENDGSIKISRVMSRDHIGEYTIRITVYDKGKPILKTEKMIRIRIKDIPPKHSVIPSTNILVTGNVLIVIVLSTISAFLTALLIGAILCMIKPCCQSNLSSATCNNGSQNINTHSLLHKLPPNYYTVNSYGQSESYDPSWMQPLNRNGQPPYSNSTLNFNHSAELNKNEYLKYEQPQMYTSQNTLCYVDHVVGKHSGCSCEQGICIRYPTQNHLKCSSHNPEEQCSDSGRGASDDDIKALNISGSLASSSRALASVYGTYTIGDISDKSFYKSPYFQSIPNDRSGPFIDHRNECERGQGNFIVPNSFGQMSHFPLKTMSLLENQEPVIRCSNFRSDSIESLSNLRKVPHNNLSTNILYRKDSEQFPINEQSDIFYE